MNPTNQPTQNQYLKLSDVCRRYNVGKTWVYDRVNEGNFPQQKKLGCMSRWLLSDLLKWELDNGLMDDHQEAKAC